MRNMKLLKLNIQNWMKYFKTLNKGELYVRYCENEKISEGIFNK